VRFLHTVYVTTDIEQFRNKVEPLNPRNRIPRPGTRNSKPGTRNPNPKPETRHPYVATDIEQFRNKVEPLRPLDHAPLYGLVYGRVQRHV